MKKAIIIGGGFAGLSAAVQLAEKGIKVTILEGSPKLGGRAYSLDYKSQDDIMDNGQHILMGCYSYTLNFLEKIRALDKYKFQNKINAPFIDENGKKFNIKAVSKLYPLNLLLAILFYNKIGIFARIKSALFFLNIIFLNKEKLESISAYDWLISHRQDEKIIEALWEPIIVSIFNTDSKTVQALLFAKVLREIFLKGNKASAFVLINNGLSENYCKQASEYIISLGGEIQLSKRVQSIEFDSEKFSKIILNSESISDFDYLISTVPVFALKKMVPMQILEKMNIPELVYSPIITIHIWYKGNLIDDNFIGLHKSKIHWIFKHEKHYSLLTSAADDLIKKSDDQIMNIVNNELAKYFNYFNEKDIIDYKILKEKRATFISDVKAESQREKIVNNYSNFYIAGDWVNTGLPSTIESAVKSGYYAANQVINS